MVVSDSTWYNDKKWKQYLSNLKYRWAHQPQINAYYRNRYALSEDVRNKSRIKINYYRYRHGSKVCDRLVDEIRAQYNKSAEEVPYCR